MSKRASLWVRIQQLILILLVVFTLTDADPHPVANEEGCTCEPGARPFESYHIHVLFYPDLDGTGEFVNNTRSSKFARALRKAFIDHFNVPQCDEERIFNLTTLCAFAVDETGAGGIRNAAPFVAPNFAIYVPVDRYSETVPWMMANRGDLDFLVHPNSCGFTCSPQDHLLWSLWGGNKWPVRFVLPEKTNHLPNFMLNVDSVEVSSSTTEDLHEEIVDEDLASHVDALALQIHLLELLLAILLLGAIAVAVVLWTLHKRNANSTPEDKLLMELSQDPTILGNVTDASECKR